jgi:hypothetical protein
MQQFRRAAAPPAVLRLVETDEPGTAFALTDAQYRVLLGCAFGVCIFIRVMIVLGSSFPVNDGGMFYAMVRDIQASSYRLPAFSSYNGMHIPFFYPPLGFYLAGVLNDLTPMSLLTIFRVVPLTLSILMLFAFFLLARDLLESRIARVMAVTFFGLLQPSYAWTVMGGGMTRALGFLLAILSIYAVRRMYVMPGRGRVVLAGVLCALTMLSHIEMAWLVCIIGGVLFIAHGRNRSGILRTLAVFGLVVVLSAPWWVEAFRNDGLAPLRAAVSSSHSSLATPFVFLTKFDPSVQPMFDVIGALAIVGIVASIRNRQYFLPAWMLSIALFDQRAFFTSTTVAVALLAAVGLTDVVLPFVSDRSQPEAASPALAADSDPGDSRGWLPVAVLLVAFAYPFLAAVLSTGALVGLSPSERSAMAWVQANTPASSRFVVVTGQPWPIDRNAEWFPVIAGRRSVATVQGSEWLPNDAFDKLQANSKSLHSCAEGDGDCLAAWAQETNNPFDYVYIVAAAGPADRPGATSCCENLIGALRTDPRYELAYSGAGATIFRRKA